ncbi:MAG: multisubunit Na+/H+ antiporter MnhE subunit [Rickettsiales bacterium]|jgi:multisubunit Na+/H+ antiporter MnhE subunit
MINIFNLFLTLFFFWILLTFSNEKLSWAFVFIGAGASLLISLLSWKLKLINKHSKFLFLHVGFYRHFSWLIISSFFGSVLMILKAAFFQSKTNPKIHLLKDEKINSNQLILLITTINLTKNLLFIGFNNNQLTVANFGDSDFGKPDLVKIIENLEKINDNHLV